MLGILLIYFIGKSFYTLAETHNRSRWTFAIIGIVTYYASLFLGAIILGLLTHVFGYYMDFENDFLSSVAVADLKKPCLITSRSFNTFNILSKDQSKALNINQIFNFKYFIKAL